MADEVAERAPYVGYALAGMLHGKYAYPRERKGRGYQYDEWHPVIEVPLSAELIGSLGVQHHLHSSGCWDSRGKANYVHWKLYEQRDEMTVRPMNRHMRQHQRINAFLTTAEVYAHAILENLEIFPPDDLTVSTEAVR